MSGDWDLTPSVKDSDSIEDAFDLFDTANHGDTAFKPVPAGAYMAVIESAEYKSNKAGTGHLIACKVQIAGGEHDGRIVWHNFNVDNPNPNAVQIGVRDLAAFFTAVNHKPSYGKNWSLYAADMPDKPVGVQLIVKGDRNEVKKWLPAF